MEETNGIPRDYRERVTMAHSFKPGDNVWVPFAGGEYVLRVVDVDGSILILKRPGSDAGTVRVNASRAYPSARTPHTLDEVNRGK